MPGSLTDETLQSLSEGDRVTYHGVRWQVCDQSSYTDPKGYAMEEWLLQSTTGKQYYLLREVDPTATVADVHWYIAEELTNPQIYDVATQIDVLTALPGAIRSAQTPYPTLQLYNRRYQFESQTQGTYVEDESESHQRITWDYWDEAHLWNLALEAWDDGRLVVYSTREVQPEDFSEYRPEQGLFRAQPFATVAAMDEGEPSTGTGLSRDQQSLIAWGLLLFGFFLMLVGI
jgi:hypothetical protein